MTPVGQPYHASGPINIRSITATLILGALTAVLAAMVVWLWEISPIPTFVIITQFAQALLIGWVLAFAIGRLRMRNPGLVLIIGFACGLASVGLVHLGHYIRFVDDVATHYRAEVLADKTLTPEQRQEALAMADTDRWRIADAFLVGKTGQPGLVGSLMLRNEMGVMIDRAKLTGWALWTLWGAEMLVVAGMAALAARNRAAEPFCEDCGAWCRKVVAPLVLPGESAERFADAVRDDDTALLVSLRDNLPESAGSTFAGATLYACDGCDLTFADAWRRVDTIKKGKKQSTAKVLVKQVSISTAMTALLCNLSANPADEPGQAGDAEGEGAELGGEVEIDEDTNRGGSGRL